MYEYLVNTRANQEWFDMACKAVEKTRKDIQNKESITDVDGSEIMVYTVTQGEIAVYNDYYFDEVYIKADVELRLGALEIDLKTHKRKSGNPF
ncbi:MAG: hypothetical protein IJF65_06590 [Clostridia bacterium]|nr:hypothetical protein [Clostridia bacterium]